MHDPQTPAADHAVQWAKGGCRVPKSNGSARRTAQRQAPPLDEMPQRCSREDSSRPGFQDGFAFEPPGKTKTPAVWQEFDPPGAIFD